MKETEHCCSTMETEMLHFTLTIFVIMTCNSNLALLQLLTRSSASVYSQCSGAEYAGAERPSIGNQWEMTQNVYQNITNSIHWKATWKSSAYIQAKPPAKKKALPIQNLIRATIWDKWRRKLDNRKWSFMFLKFYFRKTNGNAKEFWGTMLI